MVELSPEAVQALRDQLKPLTERFMHLGEAIKPWVIPPLPDLGPARLALADLDPEVKFAPPPGVQTNKLLGLMIDAMQADNDRQEARWRVANQQAKVTIMLTAVAATAGVVSVVFAVLH